MKMKKGWLIIFFFFFIPSFSFGSNDGDSTKKPMRWLKENHYLDMSIGIGENVIVNSAQWDKLFPMAKNRIKLGFGIRMNVANYWNKAFYTAPPQQVNGIRDTLMVDKQTVYFINLQFIADFVLLKWWDAGMNIDLVGASWGPTAEGDYYSSAFGANGTRQNLSPETLDLMLFGHNDFGNLNSQFYVRFWPSDNVFIKMGMGLTTFISHTDLALNNGNSRFSAGSYSGFVSLGWTFGRSEWKPARGETPELGIPNY